MGGGKLDSETSTPGGAEASWIDCGVRKKIRSCLVVWGISGCSRRTRQDGRRAKIVSAECLVKSREVRRRECGRSIRQEAGGRRWLARWMDSVTVTFRSLAFNGCWYAPFSAPVYERDARTYALNHVLDMDPRCRIPFRKSVFFWKRGAGSLVQYEMEQQSHVFFFRLAPFVLITRLDPDCY
jgi:hypothetical protein